MLLTRLTHSYLLKREDKPQCIGCATQLTIKHFLLECIDFIDVRRSCFQSNNLKDLFKDVSTPFIQIKQTRKGLLYADINNYIAGIHKVRKHQHIAFKLFLYKMCLCRADAKWFILRMVEYHNIRFA